MKIKLIDFGLKEDHHPFRPHENDAGADVFMPYDCTLKPGDCKNPSWIWTDHSRRIRRICFPQK